MSNIFQHPRAVSYYFGAFFMLLFFFAMTIMPIAPTSFVSATSSDNMSGWALAIPGSDDTGVCLGNTGDSCGYWISFNCTDVAGACSTPYGVNVNTSSGLLSGYAWAGISDSLNCTAGQPCGYGWISFNTSDLGGCPSGACEARLSGSNLTGWAKALTTNEWIRLNPSGAGVALNGNAFQGYAWSCDDDNLDGDCGTTVIGDSVGLGWINFNPAVAGAGVFLNVPSPTVTFSADRTLINQGDEITLSWTSSNATACSASSAPLIGDWNGAKGLAGPQSGVGPFNVVGSTDLILVCSDSIGRSAQEVIPITVLAPSFVLRSSNNLNVVFTGDSSKTTNTTLVTVLPIGAFSGTVGLSAAMVPPLPGGATATPNFKDPVSGAIDLDLAPAEYNGGSDDGVVFYVNFSGSVSPGTYNVRVTGLSGVVSQFVDIPITAKNFDPTIIEL